MRKVPFVMPAPEGERVNEKGSLNLFVMPAPEGERVNEKGSLNLFVMPAPEGGAG
jgi:hypothetical protein